MLCVFVLHPLNTPPHPSPPPPQPLSSSSAIEAIEGIRPELAAAISGAVDNCLAATDLPLPNRRQGKVRDTYDLGDRVVVVTTDRQSAFDRLLAAVPFKGQVLNQTAAWWFEQTRDMVPNALLSTPDPNVSVMKKCSVFPVEFVVRGYMTGTTDTSLWTHYKAGAREYCGNAFPDGMRKNDRLARNVITPTTKAEDHDEPISPADIVGRGLMSQQDWDAASAAALKLFEFGQREAAKRGLLLVDTKYEFGKDADGNVLLIDEVHTPDSSRYWLADTYAARHAAGEEPQNIDKEFLRLWFRAHCDPYKDEVLPAAPRELVEELSRRYVHLYERITGRAFVPPPAGEPVAERIKRALAGLQ
jgi:phosphoribosylaminoimidazole-succinocarboxamide synthase